MQRFIAAAVLALALVGFSGNAFALKEKHIERYATEAGTTGLLAANEPDGVMAYALDTDTFFFRAGGAWVRAFSNAATAPVLSACATTPSIVGTDSAGKITVGSSAGGIDGCVLTFDTAYAAAPACVVLGDDPEIGLSATTSTTALTIVSQAAGDPSGDVWMYFCVGI